MLPYLIVFCISIIATYYAQKCGYKSCLFYISSSIAIIPLVVLAAFRDVNVGTDTSNYIYLFINAVEFRNYGFEDYLILNPAFEIGFLFYNFIIAQIISIIEIYYIITYGIIICLTYASAFKLRKYITPHIFMVIYLFIFFSETLNTMRQYIAISFILFAVANLLNNNRFRYLLFTIVASLFHTSAIISIIIGGVYWLVKKYPINKFQLRYIILCIIVFFLVLGLDKFANMGLLPIFEEKFNNSLTNSAAGGISNSHIVIYLCTLLLLFVFRKKNAIYDLMLLLSVFTIIFYMSPNMNAILYRLTLYFNIIICISVSYVHKNRLKETTKYAIWLLLVLYVGFYFFSFVINRTSEVIPYSSNLLGI